MRRVEKAAIRPQHCIGIPFVHEDPEGFLDTGVDLSGWDNHVYLSATLVREAVRTFGWPQPEAFAQLQAANESLKRETEDLRAQLAEADKELNAVEVLRQSGNWAQGKRAGRPRKVEA